MRSYEATRPCAFVKITDNCGPVSGLALMGRKDGKGILLRARAGLLDGNHLALLSWIAEDSDAPRES
jgi:hypothetical protein